MTSHADLRVSLGSYLTGALGPSARAEIDDHLRLCEGCRAELVDLAALPGLLGRLRPGQLGADPLSFGLPASANDSGPTGAPSSPTPDGLLDGLLRQARQIEEGSRRRLHRLRVATAAVAVAAIVAAAFAAAPTLARTPAGASYRLRPEAASTRLAGQVTLIRKPWGTELALSLQGLPPRGACEAVVSGIDGQRASIGSWSATPDHRARVDVASALPPSRLASLTVETITGAPLLGVTLPRPRS